MFNTAYINQDPKPLVDLVYDKTARVLLIEDDRSTRRLVKTGIKDHCELIEAPDASQGISAYSASLPDIVFLDIELPDGNGQSILQWIMRNDPGAFVVMFSGHYDIQNVTQSITAGAKGFIIKPFDVQKMLHFIDLCPKLH